MTDQLRKEIEAAAEKEVERFNAPDGLDTYKWRKCGKLGFLSGQSWEIKFYRNARIKGQVVEE